jgi:hypothetical protein
MENIEHKTYLLTLSAAYQNMAKVNNKEINDYTDIHMLATSRADAT